MKNKRAKNFRDEALIASTIGHLLMAGKVFAERNPVAEVNPFFKCAERWRSRLRSLDRRLLLKP